MEEGHIHPINKEDACSLLQLLDLTSLQGNESAASIEHLCQKAMSPLGHVAAVCVYPLWIKQARSIFQKNTDCDIAIACVANFPQGSSNLTHAVAEIETAVAAGVDEIDLVFPYRRFLAGDAVGVEHFMKTCKDACQDKTLKVILETGAYPDVPLLRDACHLAIEQGANWLKTSTGKLATNTTSQAARVLLGCIAQCNNPSIGFKVSGGIHTLASAWEYVELVEEFFGAQHVHCDYFRIGSSGLWDIIYADYQTSGQFNASMKE